MKIQSVGIGLATAVAGLALACAGKNAATTPTDAGAPLADAVADAPRRPPSPPSDPDYAYCYDDQDATQFTTAPPKAAQGKCTGTMVADFNDACLSALASQAKCDDFLKGSTVPGTKACGGCLLGPYQTGDDPKTFPQPVLIALGDDVFLNTGMCGALAVAAPGDCAEKAGNESLCVLSTCESCEPADRPSCMAIAVTRDPCKGALAGATCDDAVKAARATADAKCGAPDAPFDKAYALVAAFICGPE